MTSKILPRRELRDEPAPARRTKRATNLRRAARGQPCLMRVAGVCIDRPPHETTVLAHFRWLGNCGTGIKPPDTQAAFACAECNRWTDSPTPAETRDRLQYECDRNFYAARALAEMREIEREAE